MEQLLVSVETSSLVYTLGPLSGLEPTDNVRGGVGRAQLVQKEEVIIFRDRVLDVRARLRQKIGA